MACETLQKDDLEDDFVVLDLPSHSFGPALGKCKGGFKYEDTGAAYNCVQSQRCCWADVSTLHGYC